MMRSETELAFLKQCTDGVFISDDDLEEFRRKLTAEGNPGVIPFGLQDENFIDDVCPKCAASGIYKTGFLGRLHHPECGLIWFMAPGRYALSQLGSIFRVGMEISADDAADSERKGEKQGCITAVFLFVFGAVFRLLAAIVLIPIQLVVSLISRAGSSDGGNN